MRKLEKVNNIKDLHVGDLIYVETDNCIFITFVRVIRGINDKTILPCGMASDYYFESRDVIFTTCENLEYPFPYWRFFSLNERGTYIIKKKV